MCDWSKAYRTPCADTTFQTFAVACVSERNRY